MKSHACVCCQVIRLTVVAAIALTAATRQANAATTGFQQGVSPTGAYSHDATYIRSANATTNFNDNGQLIVGPTTGDILRGLLEFDVSAIPSLDRIDAVSLVLKTYSAAGINDVGSAGAMTTFNAYAYGFDIDEAAATWNAPGAGDATTGGTSGMLLTSASFDVEITGQTVTFGDTSAFRTAVSNARAGDGFLRLLLRGGDETVGVHNFARFSDETAAAANRPELLVTHHTPATIADYRFLDLNTTSADTEPNSTAADFTINPVSEDWGLSAGADNAFARSTATTDSEVTAIAAGDYFSFTVTPDAGFELDLTTLSFNTLHNATFGGDGEDTNATMYFFVRSSADSFTANLGATFAQAWNTATARSIDLSDAAFQNLLGPIEFRIYIYDSGIDIAKNGARIDNVVLRGDVSAVAIPSPASLPAGLVLLGVLATRRHRVN